MGIIAGTEVRGYLLQDSIGEGGFGNVYLANQSSVGREVAVKVILPGHANKPDFIRRFEKEAQVVARLEHLHIVPLYDYWRSPDGAYLVMRLMRGGSLEDLIKSGPLELEVIAMIVDQLCSALDCAHSQGVIHRDLKPSNILLDEDNNAYLSDFGIAKELDKEVTQFTDPDLIVGSLDYLAPEQALKDQITSRTDIYSLGIVVYEMLVGEHPFPNVSSVERLFKHIQEPLPKITQFTPDINDNLNQVIEKATQKNPEFRYASSLEFAKAFREAASLSVSRIEEHLVELLTPREQEVLSFIVQGKSNREIANKLTIEFSTVKWYVRQIYKKLNVRSRVQAIVRARELDLIVGDREAESKVTTTALPYQPIENPYKGLNAFQAIDAQDFFGREELVKKLLKRFGEKHAYGRFLAVIGPSGSGKSSLVKAGLIPALWRGEFPGSESWFIVDTVIGEHPLDELEIALIKIAADQPHNLREQLQRDDRGLVRAANLILPDDQSELVLVLDQFEELFTLVQKEEEREQFLRLLYTAVTDSRSRIRIVVTLRADFYDRPLHYPNFGDLVRSRIETVMPLSAEELERAIVQPAKRVGVTYEDGLVASIINEVHYQAGALPLMQYALTELFEAKQSRILTHVNYHQVGGVVGAIARSAEEIYRELDNDGKEAVRQLFLRLINLGEGSEDTRRRVLRSELLSVAKNPEVMDEIIDTFANYRLISLDHEPVSRAPIVEVAHEAILREWERLEAWLDTSREDIRQERALNNAARDWHENNEDISFLLRGARLEHFESWQQGSQVALTPLEERYIQESIQQREKEIEENLAQQKREEKLETRNRRFLQALVAVFAVAMIIALYLANSAFNAQQDALMESQARGTAQAQAEADRQEALDQAEARAEAETLALEESQKAQLQASIGLAALSEQELFGFYTERSVLLALEALENYPYTPQAYHALQRAVYSSRLRLSIDAHRSNTYGVFLSKDGSKMLSAAQDGKAKVWDFETGELLVEIDSNRDQVLTISWSPDETRIAVTGINGFGGWTKKEGKNAGIWDAETGDKVLDLPVEGDDYLCWTPDGRQILSSGGSSVITVWDAESGEKIRTLESTLEDTFRVSCQLGNVWSPDGLHMIALGYEGNFTVWNFQTGEEDFSYSGHEGTVQAYYSPDGSMIASRGGDDGQIIIWDALTGEKILSHQVNLERAVFVQHISWSPTGEFVAVDPYGEDIFLLDIATGEIAKTFPGHTFDKDHSWSPDGRLIATSGEDGKVKVWDVASGYEQFSLYSHPGGVSGVTWSLDGSEIITSGAEGQIKVWKTIMAPMSTSGFSFPGMEITGGGAWSPDGTLFARAYMNGTAVIWDAVTGEMVQQIGNLGFAGFVTDWHPEEGLLINANIFDDDLRIYDGESFELIKQIQTGHSNDMSFVNMFPRFSPDGSMIATSSWDTDSRILDASTGELIQLLDDHQAGVFSVGWSPDNTKVATGGWDHTAKVWDVETGEVLLDLYPPNFGQFVNMAVWSPEGDRIATSAGGTVTIWDLTGKQDPIELIGHTADIQEMGWTPDGNYLLTSSVDGTGRLWDANIGIEVSIYDIGMLSDGFLSPDGSRVAFSAVDGTVRFFPVLPDVNELIDYAYDCCVVRELTEQERLMFGLDETD